MTIETRADFLLPWLNTLATLAAAFGPEDRSFVDEKLECSGGRPLVFGTSFNVAAVTGPAADEKDAEVLFFAYQAFC